MHDCTNLVYLWLVTMFWTLSVIKRQFEWENQVRKFSFENLAPEEEIILSIPDHNMPARFSIIFYLENEHG